MQKLGHSNNPSDTSLRQTCEMSTYHLGNKFQGDKKSYLEVNVSSNRSAINLAILQSEYYQLKVMI